MTGLSDHCFGCKTECKTKEAVGRAIRASSGLQGGGAFAQTHGEERLQQGTQLSGPCCCAGSSAASKAREGTWG